MPNKNTLIPLNDEIKISNKKFSKKGQETVKSDIF